MSVDTIPPVDLLEALSQSLCVWYNYVENVGFIPWDGPSLCISPRVVSVFCWIVCLVVVTFILLVAIDLFALNQANLSHPCAHPTNWAHFKTRQLQHPREGGPGPN